MTGHDAEVFHKPALVAQAVIALSLLAVFEMDIAAALDDFSEAMRRQCPGLERIL